IILALAVGVTLITNADSVFIAQSLSRDPALRASVVAAAQDYVRENPPDKTLNPPVGKEVTKAPPNATKMTEALETLQLPIGWSLAQGDPRRIPLSDGLGAFSVWLLAKVFGLFVTAAAVSLGAPFWFDVLNKFVNFRSSVKPKQ